jgi:hypothetical protein
MKHDDIGDAMALLLGPLQDKTCKLDSTALPLTREVALDTLRSRLIDTFIAWPPSQSCKLIELLREPRTPKLLRAAEETFPAMQDMWLADDVDAECLLDEATKVMKAHGLL